MCLRQEYACGLDRRGKKRSKHAVCTACKRAADRIKNAIAKDLTQEQEADALKAALDTASLRAVAEKVGLIPPVTCRRRSWISNRSCAPADSGERHRGKKPSAEQVLAHFTVASPADARSPSFKRRAVAFGFKPGR